MLSPAFVEKKANAPNQGALLHVERMTSGLKYRNSILCRDRSRAMKSTRGVEITRKVGKRTRDQGEIYPIRHELLNKSRAKMTGIKILCALFEITLNSFCDSTVTIRLASRAQAKEQGIEIQFR